MGAEQSYRDNVARLVDKGNAYAGLRKAHKATSCCADGRDAGSSPSGFLQLRLSPLRKQMLQ